jgi:hypothetical protein
LRSSNSTQDKAQLKDVIAMNFKRILQLRAAFTSAHKPHVQTALSLDPNSEA